MATEVLNDYSLAELKAAIDGKYSIFPIYGRKCISCGEDLPLVGYIDDPAGPDHSALDIEFQGALGVRWGTTDMCGACTWGEADLTDPEEW